jgi:hypothetical protein
MSLTKPTPAACTGKSQIIVEIEIIPHLIDADKYFNTKERTDGKPELFGYKILNLLGIDADFNPVQVVIDALVFEQDGKERQIDVISIEIVNFPNIDIPKSLYNYCKKQFEDEIIKNTKW